MAKLPKDCNARQIGSKARQIVHSSFDATNWEFHEITGTDHGTDCILELIEDDKYANNRLEGQIKGTLTPKKLNGGDVFSFSMDIKTINYGLNCRYAFVLFYVDVENEAVYYLPLQDYFISNKDLFNTLENNKSTMAIHIPCDNIVSDNDFELREIAKSTYIGGCSSDLHKSK
jgi:hypothetical protein